MATPATRKRIAIVLGILATVVLLVLIVLLLLARRPERQVAKLLTEAQICKRNGLPDKELAALEQALALMPEDAGLMSKLGRCLASRGETERAEKLFRDSLARNPDSLQTGFDLYDVLVGRGALDEGGELLEKIDAQAKVVAPEAYRDRALTARADLALRRGDQKKALQAIESALQVNPALDAPVRLALAGLLAADGDAGRAEDLARSLWNARRPAGLPAPADENEKLRQEALYCSEPMTARAAIVYSTILQGRGAVDEAATVLAEAWERDRASGELASALATAEVARGRIERALEVAAKIEEKDRTDAATIRGRVALARGDKEGARRAFSDAASWSPGAAEPALAAARSALDAGDKEEARRLVLSIDAKRASLDERVARCSILRDAGEEKRARDELEPVIAAAPGHGEAIELFVRIAMSDGKTDAAATTLEDLARRFPGNRVVDRARSVLALYRSETGKAVEISRDSLSASPDAGSFQVLAAALALDGGVGAAVKELLRLAESAPSEAVRVRARLQAAELYRALGRGDLAVPILEKGLSEFPLTKELRIALSRTFLVLGRPADAARIVAPLLDGVGDPVALVLAASAAQAQSNFPAAIALARRAENDPVHGVEAIAVQALAHRASGDLEGARAEFARLRALRPSAALGYVGALCDLTAKPQEAAAVLRKACDLLGPESFELDLAVALDLAEPGDEGLRRARQIRARNEKDQGAAWIVAAQLLRRGRSDEAGAALAAAGVPPELRGAVAALDKESLGSLEALLALRRHGLDEEAADLARSLLARNATNMAIALHAARALAAAGQAARAREVLERAVAAAPRLVPCRLELGILLQGTKEGRKIALETFEQGIALVPEDATLQLARGMALSELGRALDAEAAYRKVLRVDPRNAIARNNLAWLLVQKGDARSVDEALALARGVVEEHPGSAPALDTLARVLLAKGDGPHALEAAKKAVDLAPLDAAIRLGFARALDALGRAQDAANQYEVALLLQASFEGRAAAEKRLLELRAAKGP